MSRWLAVLATLTGGLWFVGLAATPWGENVPVFLAVFGLAVVFYFAAVRLVLRGGLSPRAVTLIIGAGLVFRATVFFSPPSLSDDIFRYLWDGRVQLAGHNPYRFSPAAEELAALRTPEWEGINHKPIRTIYPPLSQAVFALGALVRPTIGMQKLLFVLFDVAVIFLLLAHLRKRALPPERVLFYAWHPMVIVEFASSGHLDSLAIAGMMAGFLLLEHGRDRWAGAALGLGFLSKLGTGLLLPWMALTARGRRVLPAFIGVVAAGYACYAGFPMSEWGAFLETPALYAGRWGFNAGVFALLMEWPGASPLVVRLVLGAALAAGAVWLARRSGWSAPAQMAVLFAALLYGSPVVYPWYVVWLAPFLCLYPERAGFLFTNLVALSYLVLPRFAAGMGWTLPVWVPWVEFGVPALILLYDRRRIACRAA